MSWITPGGFMESVIESMHSVTGATFLTYFIIVAFFVILGTAVFNLDLEATAIYTLPLIFGLMAYSSNFQAVGGVLLIYLAVQFANWVFRPT